MARLFMGMMRLRDLVYSDPATREKFDNFFELAFSSIMNARATAKDIKALWEEHSAKVASGEVAHREGQSIRIDQSIDKELRKEVESFLNAAVRALKQGIQNFATELPVNIGFMFKQQGAFDAGIEGFEATDPLLAEYLKQTRAWSERLVQRRNDVEHNGWSLPRVAYKNTGEGVVAIEPEIAEEPTTRFVDFMFDRLCCFVEDFIAHALQKRMPPELTISEIPLARRLLEAPERFIPTLGTSGLPRWDIAYHTSSFEET